MRLCWLLTSLPTFERMRVSPWAFFLDKAMKIKGSQSVRMGITKAGTIYLEQLCDITLEFNYVYLTLEQFDSLSTWVVENQDDINELWNGGVDDETDS
jgi:hypothetical protein